MSFGSLSMARHTQHSTPSTGAVIIGGQHPGLGVVRSLGRRGIPTILIDDRPSVASLSRYLGISVRVDDLLDERHTIEAVLEVGRRFRLRNWVLGARSSERAWTRVPTADACGRSR